MLLVDTKKSNPNSIALFDAMQEYKSTKQQIKIFNTREKELKNKFISSGYDSIIFNDDKDIVSMKISKYSINRSDLNIEKTKGILIALLSEKIDDAKWLTKTIDKAFENGKDKKQIQGVRIDIKNGK